MSQREYYKAYDDRYRQVHAEHLQWSASDPSPIVSETLQKYGVSHAAPILEIGCGEGRDAMPLLSQGYSLLATDVSPEAVAWCRGLDPEHAESYRVLDCLRDVLDRKFSFIYAVAVLHMLVPEEDRAGFYRFFREHLASDGIGLICTMGDGELEYQSDISEAFTRQERTHGDTGRALRIAGTSCRMVSMPRFLEELDSGGLRVLEHGITSAENNFSMLMYAVVAPGL